jgi:putative sterol carrier protein
MTGDVKCIFGITQDELGYIMSREDYGLKLYDYESSMSINPEMGYLLVNALQPMIEAVNPKPAAAAGQSALDAWFFALPDRFNAAAAGTLKAIFYFDVTGEGGGDYTLNIADGKCTVQKRKPERADLKGTISAADATLVATGKLDPVAAWSMGKLTFDGDMTLAMLMVQIFGF